MSDPWSDPRLHDYLDGRMDDDERLAFERRLESDEELRRRVEAYRALGDDLREPPPPLDETFYASARERFRQRLPRSTARPATWEIAGLAAAALLVFALLVPQLWEEERVPLPPEPVAESLDRAAARQAADAPAAPAEPEPQFAPEPTAPAPAEEPVRQVAAKRAAEQQELKSVGTLADDRRKDVARNEPVVAHTPLPIRTIEIRVEAFAKLAETEQDAAGAKARPQVAERARSAVADTDDALAPAERRFRVDPRPELTDCADLRARRIDGRIEIGLSRATAGRESGGAIACMVLLPPGDEPIAWVEEHLD